MYYRKWLVWLVTVAVSLPVCAYTDGFDQKLPVAEVMPEMRAEWAAEHMLYNGMPMSIRNFTVGRPAKDILDYYERKWKIRTQGKAIRSEVGEFETVGAAMDGYYYTLQVRDTNRGAQGSLVVTPPPDSVEPNRETAFPLMPGTEILSKIESLDRGTRAETLVTMSQRSATSSEAWLSDELNRQGWSRQSASEPADASGRVLNFQRGKEFCQVTVTANSPEHNGHTMVLINWVKGKGK